MNKKIIISLSFILNIVLIGLIFLPEENIFSKSNRIEKTYNTTDEGQRVYVETEFDYDGAPIYQKTVIDSELFKEVYFSDSQVKEERNYKNGEAHGYWIIYNNNKNIKTNSRYENGDLREILKYYSNGNIKELSMPETNKIRSITRYYKNGNVESEGKMIISKNGNEAFYDRWVWYNIDSSIKKEQSF